MKLSDLKPSAPDGVDWNALDNFFLKDGPETLAQALVLTNIIKQTKILERPEVDSSVVIGYLSGIARDTETLSALLTAMTTEYEISKTKYKGNYTEDAHMFSITVSRVSSLKLSWTPERSACMYCSPKLSATD